jgi:hypothetical protein
LCQFYARSGPANETQENFMRNHRQGLTFLAAFLPLILVISALSAQPVRLSGAAQSEAAIRSILGAYSESEYRTLLEGLSGARPVTVGGQPVTFRTRYTPSPQGTLSEQFVYEYFQSLGLKAEYHTYDGSVRCSGIAGRNVIAEIPGKREPGRIYVMSAHLDSISPRPLTEAPGADDDGSGTAAVMLAAKIMRNYSFEYTLRFVAFTAEERGLCGSAAYARDARNRGDDIRGNINLDMIGYDSNGVFDVELHAGTIPGSAELAETLRTNVEKYSPKLVPNIYKEDATNLSDHSSFWGEGYPALTFSEFIFHGDLNPYIHSVRCCDTVEHINYEMAGLMTRATLATLATLAGVQDEAGGQVPTRTPAPVATVAIPGEGSESFPETGRQVRGLFLQYWQQNGALAQQGFPISGVLGELSDLNGRPYTVQYFERAVFEYHPENQPPYNVLLSQLGTFRYKLKYPQGAPNQKPNNIEGSQLFPQTGKRVGGRFLEYWQRNGGLAQQGYPVSDEFVEKSDLNGKEYLVQYFERAVFELHPENRAPYDVLLSQLGTFRYRERYGNR